MKRILAMIAFVAFVFALPACKGKSDADIKKDVDAQLATNPDFSSLTSEVKEGSVTISGTVKDDATKTSIDPAVQQVKGVKTVINNASVPAPAPPPVITAADSLTGKINDAIKDNPTVKADVAADGTVTLTGEIKKADLQKLMQKVQGTHPKKVVSTGLTVK